MFKPRTCFRWTKCNRCVLNDYGPTCLAEITKYSFKIGNDGEINCLDPYHPAPGGQHDWYNGYGPGEVRVENISTEYRMPRFGGHSIFAKIDF